MTASVPPKVPPRPQGPIDRVVNGLLCRVYEIPTDHPEADGTLVWSSTTVVVVHVNAGDAAGLGWSYGSSGCRQVIEGVLGEVVTSADPFDVSGIHEAMVRACRNLGRPGVAGCAISAVDAALWDLKARLLGCGLIELFGRCSEEVPIYGSGGFTSYSEELTARQLEYWVGGLGARAVKIKIGESFGHRRDRDRARVEFARRVIGDSVDLFVDANGGYTTKLAISLGRRFTEFDGVSWFEEPVPSDDLAGLRQVRQSLDLDVAAGEYGFDEPYFAAMVAAGAVDCLQIDVTRCGGYTSFLRVAGLAFAGGLQVSAHCAPALHVQVGIAVPNLRHIEYFHDHARIEKLMFDGVSAPADGVLVPDAASPGHGYTLREGDVDRYRVA